MTTPSGRVSGCATRGPAFERLVRDAADAAFDRMLTNAPAPDAMLPELEPADVLRWAGDRFTELLVAFAELPLDRLVGLADLGRSAPSDGDPDAHPKTTWEGSGDGVSGEPLILHAVPGGTAEARIWIHELGDGPTTRLGFALSGLLPEVGDPLPGEPADFEPAELFVPTPAGASTVLRYPVPADAAAGRYQGVAVGRGIAGAVVGVTLVVG